MKVAISGIFREKFDLETPAEVGIKIWIPEQIDLIPAGVHTVIDVGECITAEGTYPLLVLDVELPWRSL